MQKILADFNVLLPRPRTAVLQVTDECDDYLSNEDSDPKAPVRAKRFRTLKDYYASWYLSPFL